MIGAVAHIIARFFFIFAEVPYVFYIGGGISSLGPIVGPIIRSLTSKVVPTTERGKVFALLAVCDNAVPFVSGVLYTQVRVLFLISKFVGNFLLSFFFANHFRCIMLRLVRCQGYFI